ncbi:MAG TPA: hypothetical protein ENF79_04355 [Nitrososphaeria archaeon]|nr:hypothetical protein [Nitrososphaeria archaeon]
MPTLRFNPHFIDLCKAYLRRNPRSARDVKEFLRRCGRLAAYKLEERFEANSWDELISGESRKLMAVYVPQEDAEQIRRILEKYGIFMTLSSFYYFSALMVLLENWELPPRI